MKQLDCEPEDGRTEIDLTPMLDVVFIMLIFQADAEALSGAALAVMGAARAAGIESVVIATEP